MLRDMGSNNPVSPAASILQKLIAGTLTFIFADPTLRKCAEAETKVGRCVLRASTEDKNSVRQR